MSIVKSSTNISYVQASFNFEMAHKLHTSYSKECMENIHGHSYQADVVVNGLVNPSTGVVIDFKLMKQLLNENVFNEFDHALVLSAEDGKLVSAVKPLVNKVIIMAMNSTAENLAWYFAQRIYLELKPHIADHNNVYSVSVTLWEGRKNCATFEYGYEDYQANFGLKTYAEIQEIKENSKVIPSNKARYYANGCVEPGNNAYEIEESEIPSSNITDVQE